MLVSFVEKQAQQKIAVPRDDKPILKNDAPGSDLDVGAE
jgi:hypothetical protein